MRAGSGPVRSHPSGAAPGGTALEPCLTAAPYRCALMPCLQPRLSAASYRCVLGAGAWWRAAQGALAQGGDAGAQHQDRGWDHRDLIDPDANQLLGKALVGG